MTTAMQASVDQLPLSKALKVSTARAHARAEHSSFMQDLMDGRLDVAAFVSLQEQSWFIYRALENAARTVADDPLAASIVDPVLERVGSLEHDLDVLHGRAGWRCEVAALPAVVAYVDRLDEIAADKDAARLIAHHYVRYLGDLSGGQVIARMMQRHYGLDGCVLSFYSFDRIGKVKPYKDRYRAALDALPVDAVTRERVLRE
ncbi:biliverdin-producing heme oxygenase, partial [Corynebacterium mendelii]